MSKISILYTEGVCLFVLPRRKSFQRNLIQYRNLNEALAFIYFKKNFVAALTNKKS